MNAAACVRIMRQQKIERRGLHPRHDSPAGTRHREIRSMFPVATAAKWSMRAPYSPVPAREDDLLVRRRGEIRVLVTQPCSQSLAIRKDPDVGCAIGRRVGGDLIGRRPACRVDPTGIADLPTHP